MLKSCTKHQSIIIYGFNNIQFSCMSAPFRQLHSIKAKMLIYTLCTAMFDIAISLNNHVSSELSAILLKKNKIKSFLFTYIFKQA